MRHVPGLIAACVLALSSLAGSASAEDHSGNVAILNSLNALHAQINALQTTVNAIQNAAGTISAPDQSKFRITPGFFFNGTFSIENGNALLVNAINVSGVPHMIKAEVLDPSGEAILTINPGSVVQPFDAISGTFLVPNAGPWFVRFTVLDGSRADIRGSGQQINYLRGTTGVALAAE